jgi:predicted nucleic acid-binding protein
MFSSLLSPMPNVCYLGLTPTSITDVFIAASGLRHQRIVVTNNTKDFRRFEGLTLEDWR